MSIPSTLGPKHVVENVDFTYTLEASFVEHMITTNNYDDNIGTDKI